MISFGSIARVAPPGHYMLFVLVDNANNPSGLKTPSQGMMLRLADL